MIEEAIFISKNRGFLGFSLEIILLKFITAQNHTRLFGEAILTKID